MSCLGRDGVPLLVLLVPCAGVAACAGGRALRFMVVPLLVGAVCFFNGQCFNRFYGQVCWASRSRLPCPFPRLVAAHVFPCKPSFGCALPAACCPPPPQYNACMGMSGKIIEAWCCVCARCDDADARHCSCFARIAQRGRGGQNALHHPPLPATVRALLAPTHRPALSSTCAATARGQTSFGHSGST